jgi:hypothetical protein
MKRLIATASLLALTAISATTYKLVQASDHDDGETDIKSRALNLTDHYAFVSTAGELSLIMYVNPRSLPGRQYYLSENARYEFHVNKVTDKLANPANSNDYTFRVEAGAPNAAGVQTLTLTVLAGTTVVGTSTGTSTGFAASKANTAVTVNTSTVGTFTGLKLFVGQRSDGFHFDVHRFFQVRNFLANRFFGNAGNPSVATGPADLARNCEGDLFLSTFLGTADNDGDGINLWNPPSCAPDFTKNHNITSIALNIPISALGGTVFDTWSTISVKEVN